jgi:hypothetical protein
VEYRLRTVLDTKVHLRQRSTSLDKQVYMDIHVGPELRKDTLISMRSLVNISKTAMINERHWCNKVNTSKQQVTTLQSAHMVITGW